MLPSEQLGSIDRLWETLTPTQRAWLAGYLSGRSREGEESQSPSAQKSRSLHIFYATETGNTKQVAYRLMQKASAAGYKAITKSLHTATPQDLSGLLGPVLFLTSTHGDGQPPDLATSFFEALRADSAPTLKTLQYTVLGLGDRAYGKFCKAAELLNELLKARGGNEFYPLTCLDVDYSTHVDSWIGGALNRAPASTESAWSNAVKSELESGVTEPASLGFNRLAPLTARVREIILLSDLGSEKEVFHIEMAFDEHVPYCPGDAAAILLPLAADGSRPEPRLYSIASSPLSVRQEIHLTVARARHTLPDGTTGYGLCSQYLTTRKTGDTINIYVQRNFAFRLPDDGNTDIIMVGAGTGIAPFRGFLQHRLARGDPGRNWLFFGDRHAHCDFLYQAELLEMRDNGILTRLNAAFSRDQESKVYVQHHLQQHAEEIASWIHKGAHFYVCGSKDPMSRHVERSLVDIIGAHITGGARPARAYFDLMIEDGRYLCDVYDTVAPMESLTNGCLKDRFQ